jgi:hypothetical protein
MEANRARPFEEHSDTSIDLRRCRNVEPSSRDTLQLEARMIILSAIHFFETADTRPDGNKEEG